MAYRGSTKKGELQQLQYEITNEISRDAQPIARGVFGDNARHPDMASISNAELDQLYRDAYLRQDRAFLTQEAQRDPQQFLDVTDRIGVPDPPIDVHGKPIPPSGPQDVAQSLVAPPVSAPQAQAALPPATPTAPMAPVMPPPAAPPGAIAPPMAQPPLPGMGM